MERINKCGFVVSRRIKRTPDGSWEDYTAPPQPLTDEDWAQIWADFEDTDVENDFQDYMVEKYGPGYYVDADGMYWIFQQQVIRRIVDSKLAGEKK